MSLVVGLPCLIGMRLGFGIAELEKVHILLAGVVLLVVASHVLTGLGRTIIELFIGLHH